MYLFHGLLAERGLDIPAETGHRETDARRLLERVLAPDALGAVPDETARALAEALDAIAAASGLPSPGEPGGEHL